MAVNRFFSGFLGGTAKSYTKGKAIDNGTTTLASAGAVTGDIDTSGYSSLTVFFSIGNATTPATASGDLAMAVRVYEDDGTTLWPSGGALGIAADFTVKTAALSGNFAVVAFRYNVVGIDKVQLNLVNNNVAALQGAKAVYFLQ